MRILSSLLIVAVLTATANAAVITQWNFNSVPADTSTGTGVLTPSVGSGTIGWVGGVTVSPSFVSGSGSTDSAASDNSAYTSANYPAQGTNSGKAGFEIVVSTVGYTGITVSWDQRNSGTASKYFRFQYSTDGANFINADLISLAGTVFESKSVDLSAVTAVDENANFKIRLVSEYAPDGSGQYVQTAGTNPYSINGTARLDMVTISGTAVPEPATLALLALGGLVALRRRGV